MLGDVDEAVVVADVPMVGSPCVAVVVGECTLGPVETPVVVVAANEEAAEVVDLGATSQASRIPMCATTVAKQATMLRTAGLVEATKHHMLANRLA
jgi:hypothetical protein